MRLRILAFVVLLWPTAAFAQTLPCSSGGRGPLPFDPYKPSHLEVLRYYGGAMLANAPLSALLQLDPYVPSEGALLRQMGGIPFWAYAGYPYPYAGYRYPAYADEAPQPCSPTPVAATLDVPPAMTSPAITSFAEMLAMLPERRPAIEPPSAVTADTPATRNPRANRRTTSRGISVQYGGQVWLSDGAAVPWSDAEYVMIGERAGRPLYRRSGGDVSVIYVPTTPGMLAPFRRVR